MTAPNSNMRAFHVERACERYNFHTSWRVDLGGDEVGPEGENGGVLSEECGDEPVMAVG